MIAVRVDEGFSPASMNKGSKVTPGVWEGERRRNRKIRRELLENWLPAKATDKASRWEHGSQGKLGSAGIDSPIERASSARCLRGIADPPSNHLWAWCNGTRLASMPSPCSKLLGTTNGHRSAARRAVTVSDGHVQKTLMCGKTHRKGRGKGGARSTIPRMRTLAALATAIVPTLDHSRRPGC